MPSPPRVVLLGASNVARGLAPAVAALCRASPRQIFIAAGRGRAYSTASSLLFRGLPSIRECSLWPRLDEESDDEVELFAIITDLGNDLVYGASVEQTLDAVAVCIERLLRVRPGARIALTPLPLVSLERFPTVWLDTVRRSFFPGSMLSASILIERVYELDEKIRLLSAEQGLTLVEQDGDWYGLDPIHHKLSRQSNAFEAMTAAWGGESAPGRANLGLRRRLWPAWPERSSWLGRPHFRNQPCVQVGDADLFFF